MTAPARRTLAVLVTPRREAHELWHAAVPIRQEWLDHGLSTKPADRSAAEESIAGIYARISRRRPRFEWVGSPGAAMPAVAGWPTLDELYRWIRDPLPPGTPPLASDLAMLAGRLRSTLSAGVAHPDPDLNAVRRAKTKEPWPELPPLDALGSGVPLAVVLHQGIRGALHRSLGTGFCQPLRASLGGRAMPVCWYGQQEASWVGYYDALERLGLARYGPGTTDHLGQWARLVRSGGWWWPGEEVCVVAERPAEVLVDPVPAAWHGEVTLRTATYRDGWQGPAC